MTQSSLLTQVLVMILGKNRDQQTLHALNVDKKVIIGETAAPVLALVQGQIKPSQHSHKIHQPQQHKLSLIRLLSLSVYMINKTGSAEHKVKSL